MLGVVLGGGVVWLGAAVFLGAYIKNRWGWTGFLYAARRNQRARTAKKSGVRVQKSGVLPSVPPIRRGVFRRFVAAWSGGRTAAFLRGSVERCAIPRGGGKRGISYINRYFSKCFTVFMPLVIKG